MLEIRVDSEKDGIFGVLARLEQPRLAAALKSVGEFGVNRVTEAFQQSTDPYGEKWKPLAQSTLASYVGAKVAGKTRRRRSTYGTRPLIRTSELYGSANYRLVQSETAVSIGVSKRYGVYHQGDPSKPDKKRVPRRMFLPAGSRGLPEVWRSGVTGAIDSYLDVSGGAP